MNYFGLQVAEIGLKQRNKLTLSELIPNIKQKHAFPNKALSQLYADRYRDETGCKST